MSLTRGVGFSAFDAEEKYFTYIHTKLYLLTLAPTTISRLISMGGVKYTINYLQKIRKYKKNKSKTTLLENLMNKKYRDFKKHETYPGRNLN